MQNHISFVPIVHDTDTQLQYFNWQFANHKNISWLLTPNYLVADTRARRTWRYSVQPKCVVSESKLWRRWRRSVPGLRMVATCTRSTAAPCASTWSTSSWSWSTCLRSTWWTASWRTSPSSRLSPTGTPRRLSSALLTCLKCPPLNTGLSTTSTD